MSSVSVCVYCSPSQPVPYHSAMFAGVRVSSAILTVRTCGPSPTDTEPVQVQPVRDHILLGLKQDDVHLGCEQTAQDHKATQANRDAHGRCLHLQEKVA